MTLQQLIDKSAVLAEIDKMLQKEYPCDNSEQEAGYHFALYELQDFLNALEVKEGKDSGLVNITQEEYWLFTINFDNTILNCFFDFFPSKKDLKKLSNGKEYAVIHTLQLTKEQFNKLTKDE